MGNAMPYIGDLLAALQASVGGILPELLLIGVFLMALVLEITVGKSNKTIVSWSAAIGLPLYILVVLLLWPATRPLDSGFLHMITVDRYAAYLKLLIGFCSLLAVIAAMQSTKLRIHSKGMGEYYIVLLGMVVGMVFMTMARNLLMMYVALEMVSLPAYALTAYARMKQKGAEAALKYVIYGCFASGLMLYGISWLYGFTGTLDPQSAAFGSGLEAAGHWPVTMMMALVLGGFAFKVGALPFHFWMPDVMEGTPHSVASLFAVAPKVAGFAMLIRFLAMLRHGLGADGAAPLPLLMQHVAWLLAIMAMGSMLLGNLAALRQTHFRRMLAYSSIAQAGYLLSGVLMFQADGFAVVMFYLTVYLFMNMTAFLLAGWLEEAAGIVHLKEMKGLANGLPIVAAVATVSMISLTGLPPTAGFIAKLRLFLAGLSAYQADAHPLIVVLLVVVLLNTVVSLFYYLRVSSTMVFGNPAIKNWPAFRGWVPVILVLMCIPLLWLGLFSFDGLINFLQELHPFVNE
jgi:NADH-quinone oxidoreductase subunit N